MEWLRTDDVLREDVFKRVHPKALLFRPLPCTVMDMARAAKTNYSLQDEEPQKCLVSDSDWSQWLGDIKTTLETDDRGPRNGLRLIYGQRAESKIRDSMLLTHLPFSRSSFLAICDHLSIHRSIIRVLVRSTVEVFTHEILRGNTGQGRIVYNCRTSGTWDGDLALSATYIPERFFTYAILYGCTDATVQNIQHRLLESECKTFHPMLLSTIVAELERERHIGRVRKARKHLSDRIDEMAEHEPSRTPSLGSGSDSSGTDGANDSTTLWLELSMFKNGMENWRDQLDKMIEHVDELSQTCIAPSQSSQRPTTREEDPQKVNQIDGTGEVDDSEILKADLRDTGNRIKNRLRQLKSDYDFHIRDCNALIEAMSLATQLQWNQIARRDAQTNLRIAKATKEDGAQMRFIAFLGMLFLPGTFAAGLFSSSFFNWNIAANTSISSVVSPYIWVFVTVTVVLTTVLVGSWWLFTQWTREREGGGRVSV